MRKLGKWVWSIHGRLILISSWGGIFRMVTILPAQNISDNIGRSNVSCIY